MERKISGQYIEGLNFLRTVAIVGVVLYHIWPHKVRGGFLGVCLFFMISGYLLFINSERDRRRGKYHILRFYGKRIRKIYPALFIMIMSVVAYFTLFHRELLDGIREETISIFFGVNNWWQITQNTSYFTRISSHSPFTHLWFLAVELQLYLIWPFAYGVYRLLVREISRQRAAYFFLAVAVISAFLMAVLYSSENVTRVYYGTDTRAFSLFMGAFCGAYGNRCKRTALLAGKEDIGIILFIAGLFIIVCMYFGVNGESMFLYRGGMVIVCLVFWMMIFLVSKTSLRNIRCFSIYPVRWLGEKSYLVYLWHYPVMFVFNLLR